MLVFLPHGKGGGRRRERGGSCLFNSLRDTRMYLLCAVTARASRLAFWAGKGERAPVDTQGDTVPMPIVFSDSSSEGEEEIGVARPQQRARVASAKNGSSRQKKRPASTSTSLRKAATEASTFQTVGAKRVGRERPRPDLPSEDSLSEDDTALSDDHEAQKLADALKQMAQQMKSKRKRKAEEMKRRLDKEFNDQVQEALAEAKAAIQKAQGEYDAEASKAIKELKGLSKDVEQAERAFQAELNKFNKDLSNFAKLVQSHELTAGEHAATKADAYKSIVSAYEDKTDQTVRQTKNKLHTLATMQPDLRGVVDALAIAVKDYEQGVSKAAEITPP